MAELSQFALIWTGALVAVVAARATRLTPVVYYLGVGAILVNIGWMPRESREFIRRALGRGNHSDHVRARVRGKSDRVHSQHQAQLGDCIVWGAGSVFHFLFAGEVFLA